MPRPNSQLGRVVVPLEADHLLFDDFQLDGELVGGLEDVGLGLFVGEMTHRGHDFHHGQGDGLTGVFDLGNGLGAFHESFSAYSITEKRGQSSAEVDTALATSGGKVGGHALDGSREGHPIGSGRLPTATDANDAAHFLIIKAHGLHDSGGIPPPRAAGGACRP